VVGHAYRIVWSGEVAHETAVLAAGKEWSPQAQVFDIGACPDEVLYLGPSLWGHTFHSQVMRADCALDRCRVGREEAPRAVLTPGVKGAAVAEKPDIQGFKEEPH
jgi:hypothetical protein